MNQLTVIFFFFILIICKAYSQSFDVKKPDSLLNILTVNNMAMGSLAI
ncbi:hypothetical protein [Longitalea arenae]|nr:hypothetical protein [Longitalea arenae]